MKFVRTWLSFVHITVVAGVTWDEQFRVKTDEFASSKEVTDGIPVESTRVYENVAIASLGCKIEKLKISERQSHKS